MKRWVAAVLAFLFLSTATLHPLAHHAADSDCGVCHVQQASLPSAPSPVVAVAPILASAVAVVSSSCPRAERVSIAIARAPPASQA